MKFIYDDGGRAESGYKGHAGDCVARSIAIASELPYQQVYDALALGNGSQRAGKRGKRATSARDGINVTRQWFKDYMRSIGFRWVPTMGIGTGCTVHLIDGELPQGRLVVSVSKHYTAVIDGEVRDTDDPQRTIWSCDHRDDGRELLPGQTRNSNGIWTPMHRCVYGYWIREA